MSEFEKDPHVCYLQFRKGRLELLYFQEGRWTRLFTEFLSGPLAYRRKQLQGSRQNEILARAVGLKSYGLPLKLLDLSAGLGRDAFVLASMGVEVILVERSPIIAALLEDGLDHARKEARDPELKKTVEQNMNLVVEQAKVVLENLGTYYPGSSELSGSSESPRPPDFPQNCPDVIYFDPMFPERKKKSLTKIDLRIIRDIVGLDEDAEEILLVSLKTRARRVVVKRPILSDCIAGLQPDFAIKGTGLRYDVYLLGKHKTK